MRQSMALGLIAAAVALSGCNRESEARDAGPTIDRNYPVAAFDKIELAGSYDATIRTGSGPTFQAKGGENVLEQLVVEVEGGTLKVYPRKKNGFNWNWGKGSNNKVALTITVPSLRVAELAGAGGMHIDRVAGDSFEGSVAGSGDLRIDQVEVGSLALNIAGAGDIRAQGKARTVSYEIAGSGDIGADGVIAEDADISIAGSGEVAAHATKSATVSIAGSGDVDIKGGAKCTTSKVGAGNVRCS